MVEVNIVATMSKREIVELFEREFEAPRGCGAWRTSIVKKLGEAQGGLLISLGFMTWRDLRDSEQADLRAALEKAQEKAGLAFVTAYVDALAGFVERHPDLPRPLPSYLWNIELATEGVPA
jgi:hypothetical protein